MTFRVLTEATAAPVSVADFKTHAFIFDDTSQDTYLEEILLAAQEDIVNYIGEFISSTTVRYDISGWMGGVIVLPHRRILSIESVVYYDGDENATTLPSSDYIVDNNTMDVRIKLKTGVQQPQLSSEYRSPIQITYNAGYSVVSPDILQAIRIRAGEYYQSRSETTNMNVQRLPVSVTRLLSNKRRW